MSVDVSGEVADRRVTYSVEHSTKNVHYALQNDPAQAHAVLEILVAVAANTVKHGNYTGHTKADKHGGAIRAPIRRAEAIDPGYSGASNTKYTHLSR